MFYWLIEYAPSEVQEIEVILPMVGHSFLPSDRVFGRIEREIQKKNTIIDPEEYTDLFAHQGMTVSLAGKVLNFKEELSELSELMRSPAQWYFKFAPSERFSLRKNNAADNVLVKGEKNYLTDQGMYRPVRKKNKILSTLRPKLIPTSVSVAPAKLVDVYNLLEKYYGNDCSALQFLSFYKDVMQAASTGSGTNADEEEDQDVDDLIENEFV